MGEQRGSDGSYWDLEQAAWVRFRSAESEVTVPEQGGGSAERSPEGSPRSEASRLPVATVAMPPTE